MKWNYFSTTSLHSTRLSCWTGSEIYIKFRVIRNDFGHVVIGWWATLVVKVSKWRQVVEISISSINLDSCWKLFLSLSAGSYIKKMHYLWLITILGYTAQIRIFEKAHNHLLKYKIFEEEFDNSSWMY